MLKLLISLFLFLAIFLGCGEDDEPEIREVFTGTLDFDIDPQTIGQDFIDTVQLNITGSNFSFQTLVHTVTQYAPLCNAEGTISEFGTNRLVFSPQSVDSVSCNARDVLRGTFVSVFSGDSLFLNKMDTVNNIFYELRLGP